MKKSIKFILVTLTPLWCVITSHIIVGNLNGSFNPQDWVDDQKAVAAAFGSLAILTGFLLAGLIPKAPTYKKP